MIGYYIFGLDNNRQYHTILLVSCCTIIGTHLQHGAIEERQVDGVYFLQTRTSYCVSDVHTRVILLRRNGLSLSFQE